MATSEITRDAKGRDVAIKDPNSVLDYTFDWTDWLTNNGNDAILSYLFVKSTGITYSGATQSGGVITVFVSGGVLASEEFITCRITTVGGRTEDRTIYLKIRDK